MVWTGRRARAAWRCLQIFRPDFCSFFLADARWWRKEFSRLPQACGGACLPNPRNSRIDFMTVFDLIKATLNCGSAAFLIYSVPQVSQGLIIALLGLLWLGYAHRTLTRLLRR
jgi:hypothetical protein